MLCCVVLYCIVLIVREAGGRVTAFDGGAFSIYGSHILATNGEIHQQMVDILVSK